MRITIDGKIFLGGRYPYDHIAIGGSFLVPQARASTVTVKEMVWRRNRKRRGLFEATSVKDGTLVTRLDESKVIRASV
jgi:hypothetical protein